MSDDRVTEEMIEAGRVAYFHFRAEIEGDVTFGDLTEEEQEDFARRTYLAMRTLDPSIESLQAHCAEAEMRAHQWMKAHDKLKAGKPYDLPKPADLPEAIESLQAEVKRLRTLVRNYVDPFDVTPADHAMVLALGTDDEEGYRQALAAKEQTR